MSASEFTDKKVAIYDEPPPPPPILSIVGAAMVRTRASLVYAVQYMLLPKKGGGVVG